MLKKISLILLVIILIVVFRKFFLPGPLVFGDAPFFYKEGLKELINLPTAWISRGNTFGGVNIFLWIYPLMVLYGFIGNLRIVFYFPSLVFGILGMWFLIRNLKFSKTVWFFGSLIYLVNTYYLLLIDGGQVGVVLAYGLFPFVLWLVLKLIENQTILNFIIALLGSFILTIVDFRIAAICFLTVFVLKLLEIRKLKILLLLLICLIGLSSYWIIPSIKLVGGSLSTEISNLQLTSLLNSLFLYSPNWPANEFGKVVAPYFYFAILPILIFLPVFVTKEKKIVWLTLVFLFFAFLVKGSSAPFGFFYDLLVSNKFGSVMRDSTKFFIPLMLIGGILIGRTAEILQNKFKIFNVILTIYILVLVWQAIAGHLNGVLGKTPDLSDYQKIYREFNSDNNFFRSAWFPEKSPFAYESETKQALDAKDLVNFRPFASLNTGTSDRFNFINNKNYLDWFNLLGIKYLVLNGNQRTTNLSKEEKSDWSRLPNLISSDARLQKLNIGTNIPVYENPKILPHDFFVSHTFLVVGSDDIYEKLYKLDKSFSVDNQGFLFLEDGKFDPANLQNIASTSASLIFNDKSIDDLKLSFLQKDFVGPERSKNSQWALRKSGDFLNYKYELLVDGLDFHEFDYGKGIAFSTVKGEKINFNLKVPEDGNYYLEIRSLGKIKFDGIENKNLKNFEWSEKKVNLKKGNYDLEIQNTEGLSVVNVVALIPESDMREANQLTSNFVGFFDHYDLGTKDDINLAKILNKNKWEEFSGQPTKPGWIIFTDSYNSNWQLHKGIENLTSYPMYSAINGFWFDPKWGDVKINFKGDEYVRWGIYGSLVSLLLIVIFILWKLSNRQD